MFSIQKWKDWYYGKSSTTLTEVEPLTDVKKEETKEEVKEEVTPKEEVKEAVILKEEPKLNNKKKKKKK
jgi:hypothetical protein